MQGLRVSELARRAGVRPSTVRFYERTGLLAPARRAANRYRLFDQSAVEKLRLIARAKGMGMSLDDIAALTAEWPGGECRSVQARLRGFLAGRVDEVRDQRAALQALEHRLLTAQARLSGHDPGPVRCAAGCGCDAALGADPAGAPADTSPRGCTLDAGAVAARLGEWRALAIAATSAERADGGVRLTLPAEPQVVAAAAALCAAETACCDQTRFLLEITPGRVTLTTTAPGAPGLIEAMIPATTSA